MKKIEQVRGITLVALVITIVILIVLATISVNVITNGGLISRSQSGKEVHELQREKERLELIKGEVASNQNHIGIVTVDTYIEELINQGITVKGKVTDNKDGSKTVIIDTEYSVTIEPNGEKDVKITIDGKAGQLLPIIKNIKTEIIEKTKIKITVEAIRADTYKYEYKQDDGNEESGWTVFLNNSTNVTATTLALEDGNYMVKVTAIKENRTVSKIEKLSIIDVDETIAVAPVLSEGMTPVKWNGSNWIKTTKEDKSWYNYGENKKKWANVVLGDSKFKEVNGKEVLDENANYSMLVWIPRYAYKIKSMYHQSENNITTGEIDIIFIDTTNTSRNGTKYTRDSKGKYPSTTIGVNGSMSDYVVHPAFDFGTSKLPGFWVGKFESSFVGTGTTNESGCYDGINKTMMIKANVASWRNIKVSNVFDVCLNMNKAGNVYKLPTNDSKVDPHQMKNDEWGAVAYLSKSRYGKNNEEVYINNNSNCITGIAGDTVDAKQSTATINKYNAVKGQKASTNGNITGVYDMSGGAREYTAAYVANNNDSLTKYGISLINGETKYKDVYTSNGDTQAGNYVVSIPSYGNYGDAVYETSSRYNDVKGSWFSDYASMPYSSYPFFMRGGLFNETYASGVFYFNEAYGYGTNAIGFRVVVPIL